MSKRPEVTEKSSTFYAHALGTAGRKRPALAPDYSDKDLAHVPDDAVANSFGCGNPFNFAHIKEGETVLDLGAGAGLDLILAAERVGASGHVIGLDVSKEMIARAKKNVAAAGHTNVEMIEGVMEDIPLPAASTDWVISNCTINLSPDKPRVFAEITRVLKPGGKILVSDLVVDELPGWITENAEAYGAAVLSAPDEKAYVKVVEGAGLRDVRVVGRMTLDHGMLLALIGDELPIDLDALAKQMDMEKAALVAFLAGEVAGKVHSIKVAAREA